MKKLLFAIPVLVLVAAGCGVAHPAATVSTPEAPVAVVSGTPTPTAVQPTVTSAPVQPPVKDTALGDLKLFTFSAAAGGTSYYEVPNVSVNGASLILATTQGKNGCDGSGCTTSVFRFLRQGSTYTLLAKYSDALGDSGHNVSKQDLAVTSTSNQDIPALDFPMTIIDPGSKAVVTYQEHGSDGATYGESFLEGDLFSPVGKTPVFSANGYTVYAVTTGNSETFYSESPDGKELLYALTSPKVGSVSLNTGVAAGQVTYAIDGECSGLSGYQGALEKATISKGDLTAIGTMGDTPVYELSDPKNPLIVGLQTDVQGFNQDQIKANGGSADEPDGTTLVLYPPVTQTTILFWSDPFGRLIRLIDQRQLGECIGA